MTAALAVALEASTRTGSVAARLGERVLAAELAGERAHASDLLPALDALLRELGARAADVGAVVVGLGPGSYTGLRIAVATALGIARGSGARLFGLGSAEALVHERCAPGEEAVHLLDGRSGGIYFAHYARTPHGVDALVAPTVLEPADVAARLPRSVPIFGDATVADAAHLDEEQRARLDPDARPRADALLALGLARLAREGAHAPSELEPLYLRPFAARMKRR